MDQLALKRLTDAAFVAKRYTELMPDLPDGLTSRMVHALDVIRQLGRDGAPVRVTDVSRRLNVTLPGVTVIVGQLVRQGLVSKRPSPTDARASYVALTPAGEQTLEREVDRLFGGMTRLLEDVPNEDVETACRVIGRVAQAQALLRSQKETGVPRHA